MAEPFQIETAEIPGWARREEWLSRSKLKQPFWTDSDTELFMYLIRGIRLGSWKVWHMNQALGSQFVWDIS